MDAPVVYEDAAVLAVAKPAGVPVIPGRVEDGPRALRQHLEAARDAPLWVVHRIDQDTSGVVIFAKTAEAHRALCADFEHRRVGKTYVAFAFGDLPGARTIEVPLHEARRGKARPARPDEPDARAARTDVTAEVRWRLGTVLSGGPVARPRAWRGLGDVDGSRSGPDGSPTRDVVTLVTARPLTGRHHQIRVHLRALEAPIVGDPLYGKRTLRGVFAAAPPLRLALHAARLELPGLPPIEAPLPADLLALRAWLDATAELLS